MNTLLQQQNSVNPKFEQPLPKRVQTPVELADRYDFELELGQGAQGHVYKAIRKADGKYVAIKQLRIDSVQTWKEYVLFAREAEVLATLDIKGVAKFYEAPQFLDIPKPAAYIVQEYIEGQTLENLVKSGYRFSISRVFKLALALVKILEALHSHQPQVIHRDLKPGNIMMKPTDSGEFEPYIIDFGAVSNPQVQGGGSTVAGTFGFMPPEQLMGRPEPASDYYALGAMLAYLLCGVHPADMKVTDFRLIIEPHMENIPNAVVATLRQMLDPRADQRLSDVAEIKTRFTEFINNRFNSRTVSGQGTYTNYDPRGVKTLGQRGNIDIWCSLCMLTTSSVSS